MHLVPQYITMGISPAQRLPSDKAMGFAVQVGVAESHAHASGGLAWT
jgi:hypothetical protein